MTDPRQTCVCGHPELPNSVHRTDGPCYADDTGEVERAAAMALVAAGYTGASAHAAVTTGQIWRLVRVPTPPTLPEMQTAAARALSIRPGDRVVIAVDRAALPVPEVLGELKAEWPDVRFCVVCAADRLARVEEDDADPAVIEEAWPVCALPRPAASSSRPATNMGNVSPPVEGAPLVRDLAEAEHWIGMLHRWAVRDAETFNELRDRLRALERPGRLRRLRRLVRLRRWR